MPFTTNSSADQRAPMLDDAGAAGWRWAPAWILAYVALWPAPGYAEGVLVLGALAAIFKLLSTRFRGGTQLLSSPAWALTSVLFFAYWLPELVSAFDAVDRGRALREAAADLRYLPFLWLAAIAVATEPGRRRTFGGLAVIVGIWTVDALLQALSGTSPLFFGLDSLKQAISGRGMCSAAEVAAVDRLSGVLGPCNLKLGQVVASLSPFVLHAARRRFAQRGQDAARIAGMEAAGDVGRTDDAQHRRIVAHLPGAEAFAEVAVEVDLCGHLILRLLPMASRATSRVEAALARGMGEDRVRRRGARWISNGWKIF